MKRRILYMACAAFLIFHGCGTADPDVILKQDLSVQEDISSDEEIAAEPEAESTGTVCVYICGAVAAPGVYELSSTDRIYRLVEMAGGLTQDADARSVNLAQTVEDGEMIYIPTVDEAAEEAGTAETESSASSDDGRVNINTASVSELTALSGIGDAKAAAIVAYREEHGAFQSVEEIMQMSGIAQATYDRIKDEITI
ncbi:MAG: helix-hairpin-helix domain-containing protein [Clostridiales bacterium]|nr:helix-hairpin-helix domain-containing protein [Clostridiales bacterium]